jgi:membrane fusion protein, multidrug efflux system
VRDSRLSGLLLAAAVGVCGLAEAGSGPPAALPHGAAVVVAHAVGSPGSTTNGAGVGAASSSAAAAEEGGRIRTQVISLHDVTISSEVQGKIARLPLNEGDAFQRGQLLVGFDCDLYAAQLSKVEATADAAAKVFAVNQKLSALHSVGELDVEEAKAKAKEADAEAVYMRETVDRCQIAAPFSGRIAKRLVAQYEYVPAGKPLLQIVDTEDLELKLIVPSAWLSWLRAGSALRVHIEDLKADYNASIVRLGARVDPVSQTLEVSARIKGSHPELLPGMSGWAHFPDHS